VETLDKVVSSPTVNPSLKNRCFRVLRKVSHSHAVLPKSYYPGGVTLSDAIPYASGGFADIWKGQRDGNQVCVKAFRTQTTGNLDKIKRRFYREIIGWKYVSHPNVLPFHGVSEALFPFCIITPWLSNGNIIEYTKKNQRVNRLQLLAQTVCGLEYLHSLSIVHTGINPGNILIDDDGTACLGDFGITGVITDPTVVEPGSTTTSRPGVVRYMAPELLNPPQFSLPNSNPSKESDVYSLAMTAYETLTEVLPFGNARDGIIIFHVVTGDRPPRPPNTRWLKDQIWNMIMTCWSEKREQRWDIRAVYNQLSVSSIQEIAETERDNQTRQRALKAVPDAPPKALPEVPQNAQVQEEERISRELPTPPLQPQPQPQPELQPQQPQQPAVTKLLRRKKQSRLPTDPIPDESQKEPPRRQFTWPGLAALSTLPRPDGGDDQPRQTFGEYVKRTRKNATKHSARGWKRVRVMVRALSWINLLKKLRLRRRT